MALALTILFPFLHLPVGAGAALAAFSVLCGVAGLVSGIGIARPRATPPTQRRRAVIGIVFGSMTLLLWVAGLVLVVVAINNLHFTT